MVSFSRRMGIEPKKVIQIDSMDEDLKNSLWNVLHVIFWTRVESSGLDGQHPTNKLKDVLQQLWLNHFKDPLDDVRWWDWRWIQANLKSRYAQCSWNEVYDWIQFMASVADQLRPGATTTYMETVNRVLKRERSAYRFVNGLLVQISDQVEVDQLEKALQVPHESVRVHIRTALEKFSDRKKPDHRNCIKESISAVEAAAKIVANNEKGTLSDALKNLDLHPAFRSGLDKIWGYTSDAGGIRHSLMDKGQPTSDDARFMLVTCSAFSYYLLAKGSRLAK